MRRARRRAACRSARPAARRAGRQFAARWADTIITEAGNVEAMKAYRAEGPPPRRAAGRNPDDIKVLFLRYPIVDITMEAAQRTATLAARGCQPTYGNAAFQHVAPDQHRFFQVRSRRAIAHVPHQRPPVVAGEVDRQDSARGRTANQPRWASTSPARPTTSPE